MDGMEIEIYIILEYKKGSFIRDIYSFCGEWGRQQDCCHLPLDDFTSIISDG